MARLERRTWNLARLKQQCLDLPSDFDYSANEKWSDRLARYVGGGKILSMGASLLTLLVGARAMPATAATGGYRASKGSTQFDQHCSLVIQARPGPFQTDRDFFTPTPIQGRYGKTRGVGFLGAADLRGLM